MSDDVITRDENGDLAVRTVTATAAESASQYDDLYARTTDGKRALRVVGGGGGGGLPEQTGHTGFLQTDGTNASWSDKEALVNKATGIGALVIGEKPTVNQSASGSLTIGNQAFCAKSDSIAIGNYASNLARYSIQLGDGQNTEEQVLKVQFKRFGGQNYTVLKEGFIPSERLATGGTSGQVLSKTDTGMEWVDMGDKSRDCLPLSGGALNVGATLTFNAVEGAPGVTLKPDVTILNIMESDLSTPVFTFMVGNANFYSRFRTLSALGTSNYPWKTAYITQLNNGVDIGIPTDSPEGGKIVVATPPVDVGTYVLKAIVAEDGTMTTTWVAE